MNIGINGCALDTGNLGVSALAISTMYQISEQLPEAQFFLFDNCDERTRSELRIGEKSLQYQNIPLTNGRRYHRASNLSQLRIAKKLGIKSQPVLKLIKNLDVVLDISGGDSFTDLYGQARTNDVMGSKEFFFSLGIPVILLPQTMGPFQKPTTSSRATNILTKAEAVWTRDPTSTALTRNIMPEKKWSAVSEGIDMAFGLPVTEPTPSVIGQISALRNENGPLFGLNVSGLLYNQNDSSISQFGFIDDYKKIIQEIARALLSIQDATLILVPHVVPPCHNYEADLVAQQDLQRQLQDAYPERIHSLSDDLTATEVKWVISNFAHFCGTRMHACIAAISQGIPTTAIAYSDKTEGVFASVGCESYVIDPRELDSNACSKMLLANIERSLSESTDFATEKQSRDHQLKTQVNQICSQIKDACG